MPTKQRHTVTAALIYANGPIHIGHLAGCYLPADIYVRYLRQKHEDVLFISGTDEHGVPITLKASKEGITPGEVVDKYYALIRNAFDEFGISFDIFGRTSSKQHHQTASDFFLKLYEKGVFREQVTEQYFDEKAGRFLADRYITGTCPRCSSPGAYGDQCEKCGSSLNPTDLVNPSSVLSGEKPVLKKTRNWFLPLDEMQPEIEAYVKSHDDWKANVYGQCLSWLNQGLQPRAMTRDLDWGVKVPLKDAEGKVLYVWFDAPIGYISNTMAWAEKAGREWEPYWKDENTRLVHFIGKDNIVFHCIIFPAMLKAHGDYILPDQVPANEFLNLEGEKISTSRNWAVWLHEYMRDFPNKQDALRYVLCTNSPETKDNDFTWKDFQARNNNELVAILGNFVNRAMVLTHKYFDGIVPSAGDTGKAGEELKIQLQKTPELVGKAISGFRFREALAEAMNLARAGNKFLADTEPWKTGASNPELTGAILNEALQVCANLCGVIAPFLPFTAEKICNMLGLEKIPDWESTGKGMLAKGIQLGKPELLFEKITDEEIESQVERLKSGSGEATVSGKTDDAEHKAIRDMISYEDFSRMDIRIGTILEAEKVKGADKLLKLTVDIGIEKRTIVSGIAQHFDPANLAGKQVTVLTNLAPRKLRGIVSEGMILMAESDGKLEFLSPGDEVKNGSEVS